MKILNGLARLELKSTNQSNENLYLRFHNPYENF